MGSRVRVPSIPQRKTPDFTIQCKIGRFSLPFPNKTQPSATTTTTTISSTLRSNPPFFVYPFFLFRLTKIYAQTMNPSGFYIDPQADSEIQKKAFDNDYRMLFRDSDRIQTCNLLIRSQMLYSVELRSHFLFVCGCKGNTFFHSYKIFHEKKYTFFYQQPDTFPNSLNNKQLLDFSAKKIFSSQYIYYFCPRKRSEHPKLSMPASSYKTKKNRTIKQERLLPTVTPLTH